MSHLYSRSVTDNYNIIVRAILKWELKVIPNSLVLLNLLCIWSRKFASPFKPISCNSKMYISLVIRVFYASSGLLVFYFQLSLANDKVNLCSHWLLRLLWKLLWNVKPNQSEHVNSISTIISAIIQIL